MDPKACLRLASECVVANDAVGCLDHLTSYRLWRIRGGFEPVCQEYEYAGAIHCPEGGIQGDKLARALSIEASQLMLAGASHGG